MNIFNKKAALGLFLIFSLLFSNPLIAKTHQITVKKALPVEQTTQTAKVVTSYGAGTETAAVVLPPGFENRPVVVEDSQEYKDLVAKSTQLQKQVTAEKDWEAKYIKETAEVQKQQAVALEKEKNKSSSFLSYFSWIKWIFGGGIITFVLIGVGLIITCCFVPELIPVVEKLVVGFVKWIIRFIENIVKVIRDLIALIPAKKTVIPVATTNVSKT